MCTSDRLSSCRCVFLPCVPDGEMMAEMSVIYSNTEDYHILDMLGKGMFGKVVKCMRQSDGEIGGCQNLGLRCHWEPDDRK